jgi:branched-chain amino acid transport system ATP-binding protein
MTEPLLKVRGVQTFYGKIQALKGIDMDVNAGEIVTLIGSNGAGKSTLMMTICGTPRARSGSIHFDGKDITKTPVHKIAQLGISQSPEGRRIFPRMTVLENLMMGAYTRNDPAGVQKDLAHVYELFDILKKRSSQLGGTLSGGEQQMLAIGRAILSKPRLLMMDEPSMGIAPLLVARIFEAVKELNRSGLTILLVEQNARAALRLAHRGYVLETGRITLSDDAQKLLVDPRVLASYLGE